MDRLNFERLFFLPSLKRGKVWGGRPRHVHYAAARVRTRARPLVGSWRCKAIPARSKSRSSPARDQCWCWGPFWNPTRCLLLDADWSFGRRVARLSSLRIEGLAIARPANGRLTSVGNVLVREGWGGGCLRAGVASHRAYISSRRHWAHLGWMRPKVGGRRGWHLQPLHRRQDSYGNNCRDPWQCGLPLPRLFSATSRESPWGRRPNKGGAAASCAAAERWPPRQQPICAGMFYRAKVTPFEGHRGAARTVWPATQVPPPANWGFTSMPPRKLVLHPLSVARPLVCRAATLLVGTAGGLW